MTVNRRYTSYFNLLLNIIGKYYTKANYEELPPRKSDFTS